MAIEGNEAEWYVAHTRPRCEKKLKAQCERERISATLPCYEAVHKYHGKTAIFQKPLFPGYLFLRLEESHRRIILQSDYVANLLAVNDQLLFEAQLDDVLRALSTGIDIRIVPEIGEGSRVMIKHGPLQGMEGMVEKRYGPSTVLFRLDFIGQAASVQLEAWELEPV